MGQRSPEQLGHGRENHPVGWHVAGPCDLPAQDQQLVA
jgi:hypothetical protein